MARKLFIAPLAVVTALALNGCAATVERLKCGPDGAVDWDENPVSPPPHCNGPERAPWGVRSTAPRKA